MEHAENPNLDVVEVGPELALLVGVGVIVIAFIAFKLMKKK